MSTAELSAMLLSSLLVDETSFSGSKALLPMTAAVGTDTEGLCQKPAQLDQMGLSQNGYVIIGHA